MTLKGFEDLFSKLSKLRDYLLFSGLQSFFLELRQRIVTPKTPTVVQSPAVGSATRPPLPSGSGRSSHSAPGGPPERGLSAVAAQQSLMRRPMTPGTPVPGIGELPAHNGTRS